LFFCVHGIQETGITLKNLDVNFIGMHYYGGFFLHHITQIIVHFRGFVIYCTIKLGGNMFQNHGQYKILSYLLYWDY